MKKILFSIAVIAVICATTSCTKSNTISEDVVRYTESQRPNRVLDASVNGEGRVTNVLKFEFEGHQYIQFNIDGRSGGSKCVLHDPNCKCLNK